MKITLKACATVTAAIFAASLMTASVANAQNQSGASSSSSDEPSTEDILTAAIGCLATYDMVLAKADTPAVRKARQAAYDLYKAYAGETDEQIQKDIAEADAIFPDMVAKGTTSLEEFQKTCDGVFMDTAPAQSGT